MRILLTALLTGIVFLLAPQPASAAPSHASAAAQPAGVPIGKHIITQGDTLYSIARKYCMTPEELHGANQGVIGANPDMLRVGMVLSVRDLCGDAAMDNEWGQKPKPDMGGGSGGGFPYGSAEEYLEQFEVWDRGPRPHAMGLLNGMYYIVAPDDTLYSIIQRFGIAESALQEANGLHKTKYLSAGTHLYIPGLKEPPGTCKDALIQLTVPSEGSLLGGTFAVEGRARNLEGNNVQIRVVSGSTTLTEKGVALQGSNLAGGGEGTFRANLSVTGYHHTATIKVFNKNCKNAFDSVDVMIRPCVPGLTITTPRMNDRLPQTFMVTGTGGCLFENNVTVRAVSSAGAELASTTAVLEGSNIVAGGTGAYNASLSVDSYFGTGRIEVFNRESGVSASVSVRFGGEPSLQITNPQNDALLPATFTVSGQGTNLLGDSIRVRVVADNGNILVNWTDVPLDSAGRFSNQFTVANYALGGYVEANSQESNVDARVSVARFNSVVTTSSDVPPTDGTGSITIASPIPGTSLPPRFRVEGSGRGLRDNRVVVAAYADDGEELVRRTLTLEGTGGVAGGEGTYSVSITINRFTRGYIVVSGLDAGVPEQRVDVGFNGARYPQGEMLYRDIPYGECRITTQQNAVAYALPGSGASAAVQPGQTYVAVRVVDRNGDLWYAFDAPLIGAGMYSWIQESSLNRSGTCGL